MIVSNILFLKPHLRIFLKPHLRGFGSWQNEKRLYLLLSLAFRRRRSFGKSADLAQIFLLFFVGSVSAALTIPIGDAGSGYGGMSGNHRVCRQVGIDVLQGKEQPGLLLRFKVSIVVNGAGVQRSVVTLNNGAVTYFGHCTFSFQIHHNGGCGWRNGQCGL